MRAGRGRRRARPRARADRVDQGGRATDDPRGARRGRASSRVKALALHPLVPSVNVARRIFDAYAGRQAELRGALLVSVDVVCAGPVVPRPDLRGARRAARARARALRARAARDARRRRRSRRSASRGSASASRSRRRSARDVAGATLRALLEAEGVVCAGRETRPHAGHRRAAARRRARVRDLRAAGARRARRASSASTARGRRRRSTQLRPRPGRRAARTSSSATARPSATRGALPPERRPRAGAAREPLRGRAADRRERCRRRRRSRSRSTSPTAVVSCGADGAVAASDGELVRRAGSARSRCGTRPARATCSPPPTSGGIWKGCRSPSGCGGRSCTPPSPCGRPPGPPSAATLDELERALAELDPAIVQTASAKEGA